MKTSINHFVLSNALVACHFTSVIFYAFSYVGERKSRKKIIMKKAREWEKAWRKIEKQRMREREWERKERRRKELKEARKRKEKKKKKFLKNSEKILKLRFFEKWTRKRERTRENEILKHHWRKRSQKSSQLMKGKSRERESL